MIPQKLTPLLCLWLLCAASSSPLVSAFYAPSPRPTATSSHRRTTSRSSIIPYVSFVNVEEEGMFSTPASLRSRQQQRTQSTAAPTLSQQKSDPSALTFSGQVIHSSKRPLVSVDEREALVQFFQSAEARNTLFVSDAPPVPVDPIPSDLFRAWQAESQRLGAALPQASESDTQSVMQLCSNGIQFSGLHVETTVLCGAKLVPGNDDSEQLPSYELTMIHDRTQARGPKPLMWIYHQVMQLVSSRSKQQSTNKYGSKTTTSICRIHLVPDASGALGLQFESSFAVQMKFPKFLFRVLPVSKEKAQTQGSTAIRGFVEKGVLDSLQRFESAFSQC